MGWTIWEGAMVDTFSLGKKFPKYNQFTTNGDGFWELEQIVEENKRDNQPVWALISLPLPSSEGWRYSDSYEKSPLLQAVLTLRASKCNNVTIGHWNINNDPKWGKYRTCKADHFLPAWQPVSKPRLVPLAVDNTDRFKNSESFDWLALNVFEFISFHVNTANRTYT